MGSLSISVCVNKVEIKEPVCISKQKFTFRSLNAFELYTIHTKYNRPAKKNVGSDSY